MQLRWTRRLQSFCYRLNLIVRPTMCPDSLLLPVTPISCFRNEYVLLQSQKDQYQDMLALNEYWRVPKACMHKDVSHSFYRRLEIFQETTQTRLMNRHRL